MCLQSKIQRLAYNEQTNKLSLTWRVLVLPDRALYWSCLLVSLAVLLSTIQRLPPHVTCDIPQHTLWPPPQDVWMYPTVLPGPLGHRVLQTNLRLSLHTHKHMSSPSVSQDGTHCDHILIAFWIWHEAWVPSSEGERCWCSWYQHTAISQLS